MVPLTKAKRRLASAGGEVREKVASAGGEVREKVASAGGDVRDKVASAGGDVRDAVASAGGEVRDKLTPHVERPHVSLKPALAATSRVVPAVKSASAAQQRRSRRAAAKLRLAREPEQRHTLRNLVLLLALGGLGYLAYRKFFGSGDETWVEPPARRPAPAAEADKPSGGNPPPAPTAPLASEETVESPAPTTPEQPLTESKVDTP